MYLFSGLQKFLKEQFSMKTFSERTALCESEVRYLQKSPPVSGSMSPYSNLAQGPEALALYLRSL